jgi:hypothetical protein
MLSIIKRDLFRKAAGKINEQYSRRGEPVKYKNIQKFVDIEFDKKKEEEAK